MEIPNYLDKILNSERFLAFKKRLIRIKILRVSLYRVLEVFVRKLLQTNLHQQASAIAFSFTLSIFPATIFLFTLIPYIPIPDLTEQIMVFLETLIPMGLYEFTKHTIEDIISRPRGDLLSFGFLFALYFATNGVLELMNTFNVNYEYAEQRSYIKKRLIAMGMAFLFAFLLFIAIILLIAGGIALQLLIDYNIMNADFTYYFIISFRFIVVFFVFLVGVSLVYYIAPAVNNHWSFFSIGSVMAALLIILSTQGFSVYLQYFGNYNKLYGSIGTVLALMLWLYLLAWILLLGFEINASIVGAKVAHNEEKSLKYSMLDDLDSLDD